MSRIALAWELGSGSGHALKLTMIGRALQQRGHEIVYILRDLNAAASLSTEATILQAPVWLSETRGLPEPPLNYAEMLLRFSYHDPISLGGLVRAWRAALETCQPDLLVADHAPTALLAARTMGLRSVVLGEGFTIPPCTSPTPNMRPWMQVPKERLEHSDRLVLGCVNTVLGQHDKPALAALSGMLEVDERLLTTFAELDHYPMRTGESYWGPLILGDEGEEVAWPAGERRVFIYLPPDHRDFARILELVSAMGYAALVVAPNISEGLRRSFESERVVIRSGRVSLSSLSRSDFAITYGGHGMVTALLLAGVPMLMLPTNLEQFLTCIRVQDMGAGVAINAESPPANYVSVLRRLAEESGFREAAARFSDKHRDYDAAAALQRVADRLDALARQEG